MVFTLCALLLATTPELDEGRVAYAGLKYARAVELLGQALSSPGLTAAERAQALELVARAQLALGKPDKAQAAWVELLTLDPMAEEPAGAPSVRAAFLQAKRGLFPPPAVQLTRTPTSADVLELRVVNPWRLALVVELWEAVGAHGFEHRALGLTGARVVSALQPGARAYVRVLGPDGALLASLGSEAEPLAGPPALTADAPTEPRLATPPLPPVSGPAPLDPGAPPSVDRRPLSWILAGVGVAALAVGLALVVVGLNGQALSDGWPLNGASLADAQAAGQAAPTQKLAGGLTAGVGGALAITGLVLALTAPQPPPVK